MRIISKLLLSALAISAGWSVVRISDVTLLDASLPFLALLILIKKPIDRSHIEEFLVVLISISLFIIAAALSTFVSREADANARKCVFLLYGYMAIFLTAYVFQTRDFFKAQQIIGLVAIGGSFSATVAIAQGMFGLFTDLIQLPPEDYGELKEWERVIGLSEHPVEAGVVLAMSAFCALSLFSTKYRITALFLTVINLAGLIVVESLTSLLSLGFAYIMVNMIYGKYVRIAIGAILLVLVVGNAELVSPRLSTFLEQGSQYDTAITRTSQLSDALNSISFSTIIIGNGYSPDDLPQGLEIHNSLIAAVYHFGLLGLLSQFGFIYFAIIPLFGSATAQMKSTLLGVLVIFASCYLSGPTLSRRSVWVPPILISVAARLSSRHMTHRCGGYAA